jgi:hypothetical protein
LARRLAKDEGCVAHDVAGSVCVGLIARERTLPMMAAIARRSKFEFVCSGVVPIRSRLPTAISSPRNAPRTEPRVVHRIAAFRKYTYVHYQEWYAPGVPFGARTSEPRSHTPRGNAVLDALRRV